MILLYRIIIPLLLLQCSIPFFFTSCRGVVRAEDQQQATMEDENDNNMDYNKYNYYGQDNVPNDEEEETDEEYDYYWTLTPPPTPGPTPQPTPHPTKSPTHRPTWSNEAFYEIDHDDGYTIQEQQAKIYFSSMSDVILCLMCTFFWVIWIVGTIFPTRIQHLYRTEGVVVRGYVVESFTSTNPARGMELMEEMEGDGHGDGDGEEDGGGMMRRRGEGGEKDGLHGLDGMGVVHRNYNDGNGDDVFEDDIRMGPSPSGIPKGESSGDYMEDDSEGMNLPTYHAIVSYVVPGRVASGRRKRRLLHNGNMSGAMMQMQHISDHYILQKDNVQYGREKMIRPKVQDHPHHQQQQHLQSMGKLSQHQPGKSIGHNSPSSFPKPPSSPSRLKKQPSIPPSSDSVDAVVLDDQDFQQEQLASPQKTLGNVTNRRKSLLDAHTFDSGNNTESGMLSKWKGNDRGYYKYNIRDDSDYESPMGDDEYEDDPEYIGNLFYQLGWIKNPKKKLQPPEPVRVKKRFETNHLLEPGLDHVEIIVLPGNPGSGILKADFEQEEDFNYGGSKEYKGRSSHMGDLSAGMIGVALAAVSVIGAVHGALTLPYRERVYGWVVVIISLTIMWPVAMYTYKTVNKIRIYMLNKIINLEPCGDTTNLYEGLRKLPRGKMGPCSEKGSDHGNEYVLMLSGRKNSHGKRGGGGGGGVWNYDETSAISSLSGCEGLGFHRIV